LIDRSENRSQRQLRNSSRAGRLQTSGDTGATENHRRHACHYSCTQQRQVPLQPIRFSGWLRIAVLIGNYDRLWNTPQSRRNRRAFHRARPSTYTRFGSTLTISGERDAPRWL
jgi:hypothetical protein